jgi:tRNA G10  N-methylase Trm11
MKNFLVFGSHPTLSLAEFCAFRPAAEFLICGQAALVEDASWDGLVYMDKLGGTVKLGKIIAEADRAQVSPAAIAESLQRRLAVPSLDFGWSVFGGSPADRKPLEKMALPFKKELKSRGIASRWVTGKDKGGISPAAVAKLKLTSKGLDICLFVTGNKVSVGITTDVQDADAWSLRDYGRPGRSGRAGMLPPKLARILVNLAATPDGGTLLDPFCGSGTILMEAALATKAARIIGSDIEAKQISDTDRNTAWLIKENILGQEDAGRLNAFIADARELAKHLPEKSVDTIVTEGFLGPPLNGHESQETINKNADQITRLWEESLAAWKTLLKPHGKIVAVWPGYQTSHGHAFVNLEPALDGLGYRTVPFCGGGISAKTAMVYKRPDQHVSRRIVLIEPK